MDFEARFSLEEFSEISGRSLADLRKWLRQGLIPSSESSVLSGTFLYSDLTMMTPELTSDFGLDNGSTRVVSFFSGCGGLDLGFERAGFRITYANDFFAEAALTYSRNLGPIDPRSIYEIDETKVGQADVLLAGFPCQPFSNAGSRRGVLDSRGTLFWETLRFVRAVKPKVLVFENVRGLLSMKNTDGSRLVESIEGELKDAGYIPQHRLLNMADFGVPQNRYRVVIVALREDVSELPFDFDLIERGVPLTVGEILDKPLPGGAQNNIHWPLSPQAVDLLPYIPEGGSWKSVPYDKLPDRLKRIRDDMKRYHSPNFFRRFGRNEVVGTITASATPENSGILHPLEPRRFTVREVARFQTFPDEFTFLGSVQSQYKQIGNAVPPEFGRKLAVAIRSSLGL